MPPLCPPGAVSPLRHWDAESEEKAEEAEGANAECEEEEHQAGEPE